MLPITVYNQKGGQAKSTLTRDLAAVFSELGLDVLIVDFDAQHMSVSNYLGVDGDKQNPDADDITLHLIDQGKGDFDDIIKTVPGNDRIDVIPSHKRFNDVADMMKDHANYLEASKPDEWEYPTYKRFFQVLKENNVREQYDVMLVDPNAKADIGYYLGLYATRNLIIPAKGANSGYESIEGVKDSAQNFASAMDISITNLATVPTLVDLNKGVHKETSLKIRNEYPAPVYFKDLTAFEKAEAAKESVVAHYQDKRIPPSSVDIIPKYRTLATYILEKAGTEIPNGGWDREELFTGDEFWGDVKFPHKTESEPATPEVN